MPRPDEATYDALVRYIETGRDRLAETKPNPGRPTLHRLNRTEYRNAVRDLLALEIDVAERLPVDEIGHGFDNIADVLQVSPVLIERYMSVARRISRTAVGDTTIPVAYRTYNVSSRPDSDRSCERRRAGRLAWRLRSCATCSRYRRIRDFRHVATEGETTNIWASSGIAGSISDSMIKGSSYSPFVQPQEDRARRWHASRCESESPHADGGGQPESSPRHF